jgi:hypothetical protein
MTPIGHQYFPPRLVSLFIHSIAMRGIEQRVALVIFCLRSIVKKSFKPGELMSSCVPRNYPFLRKNHGR